MYMQNEKEKELLRICFFWYWKNELVVLGAMIVYSKNYMDLSSVYVTRKEVVHLGLKSVLTK